MKSTSFAIVYCILYSSATQQIFWQQWLQYLTANPSLQNLQEHLNVPGKMQAQHLICCTSWFMLGQQAADIDVISLAPPNVGTTGDTWELHSAEDSLSAPIFAMHLCFKYVYNSHASVGKKISHCASCWVCRFSTVLFGSGSGSFAFPYCHLKMYNLKGWKSLGWCKEYKIEHDCANKDDMNTIKRWHIELKR